jgi:hypothetical protein
MTHQTRTAVVEVEIAAPFEAVWRALRDPAEIRRWHGWDYDGLDEEIDAIYLSGADADQSAGTIDLRGADTRIAVEERDGRTAVSVLKGSDPLSEDDSRGLTPFDEIDEGWITFVNQLRFALERHPGRERRTEHLQAEVLWSTGNQIGLRVEEWDGAMVVVHRTGRVIVSNYEGG